MYIVQLKQHSDIYLFKDIYLFTCMIHMIVIQNYIRTIENPDEELGIAHFISIWEVKDGKLYRGHQVSQPAMDKDDTNGSYHKIKV